MSGLAQAFAEVDRVLLLTHAVRHLIDHVSPMSSPQYMSDTDAIGILQRAMDGPIILCDCEEVASTFCKNCKRPCVRTATGTMLVGSGNE
jgi:hypothetical protein